MAFLVAMINKPNTEVSSLLISDNHISKRLHVTAHPTTHFSSFPSLVKADFCLPHCTFLVSNKCSEIKNHPMSKENHENKEGLKTTCYCINVISS